MGYGITLAAGIMFLLLSVFSLRATLQFLKTSERAIGVVIELEAEKDDDGVTYRPIFEFTTATNDTFTYKHIASRKPAAWHIGEEALIAYKRNNPYDSRLLTYYGTFNYSIILMAISAPLLVIGGGYFLSKLVLR